MSVAMALFTRARRLVTTAITFDEDGDSRRRQKCWRCGDGIRRLDIEGTRKLITVLAMVRTFAPHRGSDQTVEGKLIVPVL